MEETFLLDYGNFLLSLDTEGSLMAALHLCRVTFETTAGAVLQYTEDKPYTIWSTRTKHTNQPVRRSIGLFNGLKPTYLPVSPVLELVGEVDPGHGDRYTSRMRMVPVLAGGATAQTAACIGNTEHTEQTYIDGRWLDTCATKQSGDGVLGRTSTWTGDVVVSNPLVGLSRDGGHQLRLECGMRMLHEPVHSNFDELAHVSMRMATTRPGDRICFTIDGLAMNPSTRARFMGMFPVYSTSLYLLHPLARALLGEPSQAPVTRVPWPERPSRPVDVTPTLAGYLAGGSSTIAIGILLVCVGLVWAQSALGASADSSPPPTAPLGLQVGGVGVVVVGGVLVALGMRANCRFRVVEIYNLDETDTYKARERESVRCRRFIQFNKVVDSVTVAGLRMSFQPTAEDVRLDGDGLWVSWTLVAPGSTSLAYTGTALSSVCERLGAFDIDTISIRVDDSVCLGTFNSVYLVSTVTGVETTVHDAFRREVAGHPVLLTFNRSFATLTFQFDAGEIVRFGERVTSEHYTVSRLYTNDNQSVVRYNLVVVPQHAGTINISVPPEEIVVRLSGVEHVVPINTYRFTVVENTRICVDEVRVEPLSAPSATTGTTVRIYCSLNRSLEATEQFVPCLKVVDSATRNNQPYTFLTQSVVDWTETGDVQNLESMFDSLHVYYIDCRVTISGTSFVYCLVDNYGKEEWIEVTTAIAPDTEFA